jgi:hypothetical protein
MPVARPVSLSDARRGQLRSIANSRTASMRFVQRAKMILLAGEGLQDKQTEVKQRGWRNSYNVCARLLSCAGGCLTSTEVTAWV